MSEETKPSPTPEKAAPKAAVPAAEAATPPKPTVAKPGSKQTLTKPIAETGNLWMTRRNFLSRAGWAAFFSFVGTMLLGSLRFMFPRVLFEPSTVFKAGFPGDYPVGAVSTKWVKDYRTWIVRTEKGFYAIFAQCTHLGCTPRWLEAEGKFKCPCHGSGFTMEAVNFEGPAPRPLERVQITLAEDGQLLIDTSIRFREELGQWSNPNAFLNYA
ncbi:MAG: Rieske 2Fe-2S domain-containing protein [candidate division KSB1 bacterium]|nr:Rieske 2Fe-2S domain-containing protein [candidate division KSB1 bacterium]MDZ7369450.1 Rieske 2Fe-2S domain-containing protein [candidate division KSB1 bacterium]MDZ7407557.1 Rieske 2Fe-2S domain-containing protein [candidate division KSB1 bacterium]